MTITQAMHCISSMVPAGDTQSAALHMALAALREKEQREHPQPIPLDELLEMTNRDWVWVVFPKLDWNDNGWYRARWLQHKYSRESYGETWVAYREKTAPPEA